MHPYDVAAIAQADRYFAQDNVDSHYMARRKSATIVACDVQNPSPNVFAGCMGTATAQEGFDILLTLVGDAYLVQAATPAGEELLQLAGPLPDADAVSLGRREQVWQDAAKLLRRHKLACDVKGPAAAAGGRLRPSRVGAEGRKVLLLRLLRHGLPVVLLLRCAGRDRLDAATGRRTRQWDGCLLTDFALVAGGHNFRKQRAERYRHRFYRKGKYLPSRCGFVACVGCGRCVTACTTHIANPVELYNALLEIR